MKTTNESRLDASKIYFHGSSEPKISKIDAPSFEHPFYVTSDLHYAMAFCTKSQSMTGEYSNRTLNFTPSSQNYVYAVTLKPSIKIFDFRNHESGEFKRAFKKILGDELLEYLRRRSPSSNLSDIYEFCIALADVILDPVYKSKHNFQTYLSLYDYLPVKMTPKMFMQACSFKRKLGYPENTYDLDVHQIMAPLLKALNKQGYQAIQTEEADANEEFISRHERHDVHTKDAIGVFDVKGLDQLGIVPMKYEWLKKINPSYLDDNTNDNAYKKIKAFIRIYKSIAQKNLNESKAEYMKKFGTEPDVDEVVDKFWNVIRHKTSAPQNDIDWWIKKPYIDFKKFVIGFDVRNKKERRDNDYRIEAMNNDAKLLGEKDGYEIWYVPTYEAMRILGRFYKGISTTWCVASDDPSFWFDIHDASEFMVLVRKNPQHDEFDKIAIEMQNGGNYYDVDDFIMWDAENEDDRFANDELMHYAWQLFKQNGEKRKGL